MAVRRFLLLDHRLLLHHLVVAPIPLQLLTNKFRPSFWSATLSPASPDTSAAASGSAVSREHLSLDNETGIDRPGSGPDPYPVSLTRTTLLRDTSFGLILIENLAHIGYEVKNMYMASYDWRLSFQNTEVRDQSMSRLKSKMELYIVRYKWE